MIVAGRSGAASERPETQVDDVEDYDYDNPADRDAYCPDMDNNDDAYGKQNAPDTDEPDIGNINKIVKIEDILSLYFVLPIILVYFIAILAVVLFCIFWQLLRQIPVPSNSAVVAYTNN